MESNCSPKELRINYLKIAKRFHPDKVPEALVKLILNFYLNKILINLNYFNFKQKLVNL